MEIVFDFEATGAQRNHAHPYDLRNRACNLGFKNLKTGETKIWKLEYNDEPYGQNLKEIQTILDETTLLIGANVKFDLAWLSRYGLHLGKSTRIFDVQLAYYIITNQQNPYPSLDGMASYFGVEQKLDIVKEEYWNRGLDTDEVPYDVLCEYLEQDLNVTEQVYHAIKACCEVTSHEMQQLIKMSMLDLVVLQDIEKNGIQINLDKSIKKGDDLVVKISKIDVWLRRVFGVDWFNPNSGDHLSVFLYGGTILMDGTEDYEFTYKDGRTITKTRKAKIPYTNKGLFKPLEGSELAKDGFYATNEGTLVAIQKTVKGEHKKIIDVLLHRAKLEKLRGTYYHGLPKRIEEMGWGHDNIIHSSFNQCTTVSGRLSSTKPNVQNMAKEVNEILISRFLC